VTDYSIIAVLILVVTALSAAIMVLTHLIGPKRTGPVKDSTYEAGVQPIGDARRRFNVRFYLVAVLFVVFDVEVVFLYPWAVLFPRFRDTSAEASEWARQLTQAGYGPGFFVGAMAVFFVLLTVGFFYEWRKGVFRWD
jgi:NADH-quinone oxidoreductase subunit A